MDGIWSRTCAVVALALLATLCAAAPALATDGYVKGKKWHDVDADGKWDYGEQPVKDWFIYVDVDRDGTYDAGEPYDRTDSTGYYAITGIKWWKPNHDPRTYDVREKPASEQPDPDLDGCSYPSDCKWTLTFKYSDHMFKDKNFGNYEKPKGKLIVKKYNLGGDQSDAFSFDTTGSGLSDFDLKGGEQKTFAGLKAGTYKVTEEADPRYALTYAKCDDGSDPSAIGLSTGETVTCIFKNTRKTGQIKVVKDLIPANDPGTFDLKVDGKTEVSGGDGANATVTVPTGTNHSVAETGTDLSKYASSVACTDGTTGGTSASGIEVKAGETTVCTFTNTRKPAKIKVVKDLIPASDAGRFDLKVGDEVVADEVGDGGAGEKIVAPGTYTVSETGAGLAKYDTSVACDNGDDADGPSLDVTVESGETVTCTITNKRKQGTIKVVKALIPASDAGRFDLKVGDDVVADGVGDAGAGQKDVAPGTYTVSEAGDGDHDLDDYVSSVACDNGATADGPSVDVTVDSNEVVTCTITNTRKGDVTVTKTEGGSDTLTRTWVFTLSGGPGDVEITRTTGDGNPMDFGALAPGDYTLCEVDLPAGWFSSLGAAVDGKVCVDLTLESGESETFTVDNTAPAIQLVKQVRRAGDAAWAKETTMLVGQTAEYLLTVTNEGVGPLVDVQVADDRCDSAPAFAGGDDDGDAKLDETETWTYRCDHVVTAADGASYVNTAGVTATDERGNPVGDDDTAKVSVTTPPVNPPENPPVTPPVTPPTSQPDGDGGVAPEEVVSGAARLRGPSGCVSRRFNATVRGRQIRRVTFFVDGRKVKTVNAKRGQRVFKLGINPARYGKGRHRVNAKVVFRAASGTKARTLRLTFTRCGRQAGLPRFTG